MLGLICRIILTFLLVFFSFFAKNLNANIINVPDDFETIQEAIDACENGDTTLVHPGIYNECIVITEKNICLGSLYLTTGLRSYADSTIISGEESRTEGVIYVTDTSNVVLSGFSIINGYGFYANFDMSYGSGIMIRNSEVHIENCIFRNNGPGIYQWVSNIIFCIQSSVLIRRCIANNNTSNSFLSIAGSDVRIVNSTLALNTIDEGFFLHGMGNLIVVNSILWNCDTLEVVKWYPQILYSCVKSGYEGEGNIDTDPLFNNPDESDFGLTEYSPCVDAGVDFLVIDGDTLINLSEDEYEGFSPDMGAFESPYHNSVTDCNLNPSSFILYPAYPNPFNSSTTITYGLRLPALTQLTLYDLSGQKVKTLFEGYKQAGFHSVNLNANDLTSGLYFVRLEGSNESLTGKIMLIK